MNGRLLIALCLAVGSVAVLGGAATTEEKFETLFGNEVRKAARTPIAKDDAELAHAFLKAGGMLAGEPDLKVLLYQKAAELGSKDPAGHAAALEAVDFLVETVPNRRAQWETYRLNVRRAVYPKARRSERADAAVAYLDQFIAVGEARAAAGQASQAVTAYHQAQFLARSYQRSRVNEITAMIRSAGSRIALQQRRDTLKAKLDKDPTDASLRKQLVMLELLEFDNPATAAKLLNEELDEYLRTYIPLAAMPIEKTAATVCVELGKWYAQFFSKAATTAARTTAYKRATAYYRQFLAVHKAKDTNTLRAELAIKRLDAQAKKLGIKLGAAVAGQKWMDLLKLIDPAKHKVRGEWVRKGAELACSLGTTNTLIAIPVEAMGGYDMKLAFTVKGGKASVVVLPVGAGSVSLIIGGWGGSLSGLSDIDGRDLSRGNPTTIKSKNPQGPLRLGAKATLDIRVRVKGETAEIAAALNGKKLIAWSGKPSSLKPHSDWRMRSKNFGLGTHSSQVVWHSVRLQLLDPIDVARKWVSKDARFKVSSVLGARDRPRPSFLTGEGKSHGVRPYTIHTAKQANPHVTVALKRAALLMLIVIENRRDVYAASMTGLGVEVSLDGKRWKEVWQGDKARPTWTINLKTPVRARYIRIGRGGEKETYLALAGVKIYAIK